MKLKEASSFVVFLGKAVNGMFLSVFRPVTGSSLTRTLQNVLSLSKSNEQKKTSVACIEHFTSFCIFDFFAFPA